MAFFFFESDRAEEYPGLADLHWLPFVLSNWITLEKPSSQIHCFYIISSGWKLFYFLWKTVLASQYHISTVPVRAREHIRWRVTSSGVTAVHFSVLSFISSEGLMSQNPSGVGEPTSSRESVKIDCVFLGSLEGWRHLLSACKKDALLLGLCLT